MELYSTKNKSLSVSLKEAVFKGIPADNGLFLPGKIPKLPQSFFKNIDTYSLKEIAFTVSQALIDKEIGNLALQKIIDTAITFDAPIVEIKSNIYSLELFHGPSLAFKDFGARFMAAIMAYYLEESDLPDINILVATSGDTGSAVAQGFLNMDKIKVTILYPGGKVSQVQEKQLTTLGQNITALEIDGTFDDCQRMVKEAFLDKTLSQKLTLSSANSINISRLIPQSFYYFYAYAKVKADKVIFSVPSGNFGNLCGGIIAKKMGLPVEKFIAGTNINDIIPKYLNNGIFTPKPSLTTITNAMDVGNPSNFARLSEFYANDVNKMRKDIIGKSYLDKEVKLIIKKVYNETGYIMDPHGAIAYLGLNDFLHESDFRDTPGIFLETAHPAKFYEELEDILQEKIDLPKALLDTLKKEKKSIKIKANLSALKDFLLQEN